MTGEPKMVAIAASRMPGGSAGLAVPTWDPLIGDVTAAARQVHDRNGGQHPPQVPLASGFEVCGHWARAFPELPSRARETTHRKSTGPAWIMASPGREELDSYEVKQSRALSGIRGCAGWPGSSRGPSHGRLASGLAAATDWFSVAVLIAQAGAMTGEQDCTARRAGYPARNHPNRRRRPMPGAVTVSLWLRAKG